MQSSEEWKSLFPISSVHSPPLLIQNSSSLGPLFFNPIPESSSLIFSSSDLSPPFLPPPPHLSLHRFLQTSTSHDSSVLPTIASSISSSFNSEDNLRSSNVPLRNRLEPLYCPNNQALLFFPTGANLDCVGFLVLSVKDSKLISTDGSVLTSQIKFDHQIVQLTACPSSNCSIPEVGDSACVGFLLACNMYAVNWFSVQISGHSLDSEKPALVLLGSKKFTTCMVAYACWNPHMHGECVVLLESGALFLFDMDSCLKTRFRGKRISVAWDELSESTSSGWFSCEFSWHPRILVVANNKAIYMVDLRFGKCQQRCILRLGVNDLNDKDEFVLFSKVGSDDFLYVVASEQWLFLCDIRKPLSPLLKWAHHLLEPRYMNVLPLSEMRSMPHDVSAEASAIILGSLWNNEFSFFCYGRPFAATKKSSDEICNLSNSFYAWELPSPFLVTAHDCFCGKCLIKQEFSKDDLPEWIKWQHKRQLILGLFILSKNLSSLLPKIGEYGGFTLVRLMSTGKLELQQYCASSKMASILTTHGEMIPLRDSLLCSMGDEKYKYRRKFYYIKLENLYSHFSDKTAKSLFKKFCSSTSGGLKEFCNERFEKFMSEKLKPFCDPPMWHLDVVDVFKDVNMPTSLYEIVSRLLWTALPMNVLKAAFPEPCEVLAMNCKNVSPEFLAIPDESQLPPFFLRKPSQCSNKRSSKVQDDEDFVGPVLPLPALMVMNEISRRGYSFVDEVNEFSTEDKFTRQCEYVVHLTKEMRTLDVNNKQNKVYRVSLNKDCDETWVDSAVTRPLFMYKPTSFVDEVKEQKGSVLEERYNTIVAKSAEDGDFFAGLCPMELKFDFDSNIEKFTDEESSAYKLLKKQFLHWQNGFMPYKNLCTQLQDQ
ncbi:uncharacterized protein LOC130806648 isoform X1 [Amaranthus tricolor]|uniref:uncharacterized protein LOC130806648 isoform X1 n=1 Tax=Amaranthus tricolor TaxID=29722 RepID=UPI002584B198|nr:uncharacterized protein LOC130806648 isoform X1 [Amaranthus tricolor]XP_057527790.1 uncharacterized protein LOC130806648 isoform X1 [Amaranthus tricolor]